MNKTFEKIYSENNIILNKDMALKENTALFEKVYAEAEMLNEMNPKLRALLAAGLIGTAGLGATSCSTPNDDYEEPTPIEQPATPETPGSTTETPETPAETEDTKETEDTTFKAYGFEVTPEQAESLAKAIKGRASVRNPVIPKDFKALIYENGFTPAILDEFNKITFGEPHSYYIDPTNKIVFYVPVSMAGSFDNAIAEL